MTDETKSEAEGSAGELAAAPAAPKQAVSPFDWLRLEVDHLFDEFRHHQQRSLFDWPALAIQRAPSVDLEDRGEAFCLTAELPGCEAKDVTLEMKDRSLRIAASREEQKEERSEGRLLSERQVGRIERLVPLPQAVDVAAATAALDQGVLTVTLPKRAETAPEVRRIPITS